MRERERERERERPTTPTRAIDELIGEEEQSENRKKEEVERNREWAFNSATLKNSKVSCDPQGSYGDPTF